MQRRRYRELENSRETSTVIHSSNYADEANDIIEETTKQIPIENRRCSFVI